MALVSRLRETEPGLGLDGRRAEQFRDSGEATGVFPCDYAVGFGGLRHGHFRDAELGDGHRESV